MARFEIVEGAPGQGKSLYTARKASKLIKRNKAWYAYQEKKYEEKVKAFEYRRDTYARRLSGQAFDERPPDLPRKRLVASNIKFSEDFEKRHEGYLEYWSTLEELIKLRDVDVLWDEIATELDARNWPNLSPEVKRFLSQYRKRGVDIYANTQDFSMVDARARIMITGVMTLTKIIGSRDPSTTKPDPKHIWGLVLVRQVTNYKETDIQKKKYALFGFSFFLIERELVDIYDTRQDIKQSASLPLRHDMRKCPDCGLVKTLHH